MYHLYMGAEEIYIPRTWMGMTLYEEAQIGTITEKMRFGDPGLGWDGNAGLAIYLGPYVNNHGIEIGTSWHVWMFGDGEPYCVMRARPGTHLDERVIIYLMEHDTRYHNVAADVKAQNERHYRELQSKWRIQEEKIRNDILEEFERLQKKRFYGPKPNRNLR